MYEDMSELCEYDEDDDRPEAQTLRRKLERKKKNLKKHNERVCGDSIYEVSD
jgi:hypothetical protein